MIKDGRAAMAYVGKPPWHGLGHHFSTPPKDRAEFLKAAGLDWEVRKMPCYASDGQDWYQIPNRFAMVPGYRWGQEDCPIFGQVSQHYEPLQNAELLDSLAPFVESKRADFDTAGALGNGQKVWVLLKLKNAFDVAGDTVEKYILAANGHDGRTAVDLVLTPVRVVCQNTLSFALSQLGVSWKIYHAAGLRRGLKDVSEAMAAVLGCYDDLEGKLTEMAKCSLTEDHAKRYFACVFPDPKPAGSSRVSEDRFARELAEVERQRKESLRLFEAGQGNGRVGIKGTLWAAYNGVVEFIDHRSPHPSNAARFNSLFFGLGSRLKARALSLATEERKLWKN